MVCFAYLSKQFIDFKLRFVEIVLLTGKTELRIVKRENKSGEVYCIMFKNILGILCLTILLTFSGCGEPADPSQAEQSDAPIMQVSNQFDVRQSEWKCDEQLAEAQILQVDGFRLFYHDTSVDWEEQKNVVGGSAMLVGDTVYSVCLEHDHDKTELELHLHKMTQNDSETFVTTLHHEEGQELMNAQRLPDGRAVVLLVTKEALEDRKIITACEALILDETGACVKQFDVTEAFLQSGMLQDGIFEGEYFCDSDGFLYVLEQSDVTVLHVIDTEGNLIADTSKYSGTIHPPALDENGEFFFLLKRKESGNVILWFDKENKEFRQMSAPEKENIKQLLGFYHNYLYYLSGDRVTQWNLESGERKKILSLEQLGANQIDRITDNSSDYQMSVCSDGRLLFMKDGYREQYLAILAKELTPKEQLKVTSLMENDNLDLKSVTARISREMEQYHVEYNKTDAAQEDYRNRMITDMMAGEGADVLFVSEEDMRILQEKGLLADIGEFLPEDLLKKMWTNMMSMGEMDGMQCGIPMGVKVSTLLVQNNIWKENAWTIEDVLELAEAWQKEYLFTLYNAPANVASMLQALACNGLPGSDFVDLDRGICRFDSPEFIKVLEVCMQYAENTMAYDIDSMVSKINNGDYMGTILSECNMQTLIHMYLQHEGVLHTVGYPTERGTGHYLTCKGMLVVNKNCKSKEAVQEYLEKILSKKIQSILTDSGIPLRNDMEMNDFEYEEEYDAQLKVKELVSMSVPYDSRYDIIKEIILEEIEPYYYGERTAQETARIIQNRVQLYLDERK